MTKCWNTECYTLIHPNQHGERPSRGGWGQAAQGGGWGSTHLDTRRELNHLFGLDVGKTVHTGDTITDREHASGLLELGRRRGLEDACGMARCTMANRESRGGKG